MSDEPEKPDDEPKQAADEYGAVSERGTFRIERVLPGPIERIWAYLTDPEKRRKSFATGPMDLRTGGQIELKFRFADLSPEKTPPGQDEKCEVYGRITQCDPPRLLSYTWGNEQNASEVTFELKQRGKSVLLVVTHRRLGDPGKLVRVASGWHTHLGILTDHLSGLELRPFWAAKARMQEEYGKRLAT
jgi:uncharacterized protein YndB with AHSA1/START domain